MITGKNAVINVMFILAGILCGFLLLVMHYFKKDKEKSETGKYFLLYVLWFFLLMVFGWLNVHRADTILDYAEQVEGMDGAVSGRIYDIKVYDNYTDIYIKADCIQAVDNEKITYKGNTNLLVRIYDMQEYKLGQKIEAYGTFALFKENTNPGGFNSKRYYENKNIFLFCDNGNVVTASRSYNIITQYLRSLRGKLSDVFDTVYDDKHSGIIKTMLLGDKTDLDADVKREYRINGIAHVLAISGLHIAMIGMWIFKKLRKYTGSYILSGIAAIILIVLYGIMTGLGTATFRAVIMLIMDIAARISGRTSDLMTSMGVSCVILCMVNPLIIRDAGFLLSFGAVFAIGGAAPVFQKKACSRLRACKYEKLLGGRIGTYLEKMKSALTVSLSINLVITPIIIYFYYEFPLYGIIINLFVIPLMSVVVMLGIISGVAGLIWSSDFAAIHFLSEPVELVLDIYDILCDFFGRLPCSNINTGHISILLILIYYGTLAIVLCGIRFLKSDTRIRRSVIITMLAAFAVCIAVCIFEFRPKFRLVFLDVGQGDGILITTDNGTNILIDGGSTSNKSVGEYVISTAIKYYGMSDIDYVFLTHGDEDHISGIKYLIEEENTGITIDNLVIAWYGDLEGLAEITELAKEKDINIQYMDTGDRLVEYGTDKIGAYSETPFILECIYPDEAAINALEASGADLSANDLSLVLRMDYGELSVLFTGDIGSVVEEYLVEKACNIDCDILKLPHHGSKYSSSTDFLAKCSPYYSVISCGLNNLYGHPHAETLSRLETIDTTIFRTDLSGAVCVEVRNGKVMAEYYGGGGD